MIARPTFSAFRQIARPISLASRNAIPRRSFLTPLQARLLSSETKAAIDRAVATTPVVLFMKGTPDRSPRERQQVHCIPSIILPIPRVLTAQDRYGWGIKEYSDWPTIPQLYIDKEFVGGCDILMSMHNDGSLAKMLEEKGVLVPADEEPPAAS
ncbi:hypothetical protein FKW77_003264 [Venturia effusa]|uniref:Uncharacterized protein n=1 Tax=Venturia effusa TaxID=50376 RepID=A0A517LL64_9PEZI|nr:hypothetical protein FKW77_003264 [Venturia effusa]